VQCAGRSYVFCVVLWGEDACSVAGKKMCAVGQAMRRMITACVEYRGERVYSYTKMRTGGAVTRIQGQRRQGKLVFAQNDIICENRPRGQNDMISRSGGSIIDG
jgi:hypothetical protein